MSIRYYIKAEQNGTYTVRRWPGDTPVENYNNYDAAERVTDALNGAARHVTEA